MDNYKKALEDILLIRDNNAWIDCKCHHDVRCKLCQIGDIIRKTLKK